MAKLATAERFPDFEVVYRPLAAVKNIHFLLLDLLL